MAEVTAKLLILGNIYLCKNVRFHLLIPLFVYFQGLNNSETLPPESLRYRNMLHIFLPSHQYTIFGRIMPDTSGFMLVILQNWETN